MSILSLLGRIGFPAQVKEGISLEEEVVGLDGQPCQEAKTLTPRQMSLCAPGIAQLFWTALHLCRKLRIRMLLSLDTLVCSPKSGKYQPQKCHCPLSD